MNAQIPAQNPNRLLVLDENAAVREVVAWGGYQLGYCVGQASNESQFREQFAHLKPSVIVLDPHDLSTAGIEIFSWLAAQRSKAVIVITGESAAYLLSAQQELGLAYGLDVSAVLQKPLTPEAIDAALAPKFMRSYLLTEDDLRRAVDRAQLRVHYQPKVRIADNGTKVTGIEALLRWDHPDHGLIYPDQFIGIAEQHGLIAGLTDYVLQAGIEQLSDWNRAGLNLNLSVNLSPKLVTDVEFPDRMDEFLRERGVAPEQLTIEITETAALENPAPTFDILSRLRLKRIGLSLDDFGTGYSPLTQLYKLPFSEVKIDRCFGMELPHVEPVRMIVRAMIDLAHNLGLGVTCEGVESAGALSFLQQSGCDHAQGYYIARPMPQDQLRRWLAQVSPRSNTTLRRVS
jgi:EAL domain-containing protein (putative c-di-GMP-specific phosphodiesterase class I)